MDIIKSRKTTEYIFAFMGLFVSLLLSCSDKDANTAEERALAFAQNYFNLRYKQSLTLCTEMPRSGLYSEPLTLRKKTWT